MTLSVERWCYLSNRGGCYRTRIKIGRNEWSVVYGAEWTFLRFVVRLYIYSLHIPTVPTFRNFFFLLFLANCSNSKIISLFLLELTHTKLTRSIEGIFGNKGKVFFLTTKFLRGMEKDGRACVNGRFVSNDRWRAQIKVESSEREPSWKREPFPLPLCICTTYTRPSRPNISR